MKIIRNNTALMAEIGRIAETAGYLWEKGWAERNGGNISVNLTSLMGDEAAKLAPIIPPVPLEEPVEALAGNVFYVTGTNKRMRYVAQAPFGNGSIIRIDRTGAFYDIVAEEAVMPTSELPSHLAMHNFLLGRGIPNRVVLHTHPTDLIGLSHCTEFLNSEHLTRTLWSMIPECRVIVPRGIGVVPYEIPGTMALARATIEQLDRHDVVMWEKHGVLAVGQDIIECFDAIDTLSKSAQIYLNARMAGYVPQGLSDRQLADLVPAFHLPE